MECPTGKICYGRKQASEAKSQINRVTGKKNGAKYKAKRVYFCEECRQWHVTSSAVDFKNNK